MQEQSPPDSLYDNTSDDSDDDFRQRREAHKARVFLGALNALIHMAVVAVLLAIVGHFLRHYTGSWARNIVYDLQNRRLGPKLT